MKRVKVRTYMEMVRFYRDERGVATIFACFMIMMMILVGGIGVDLMHNEMERTRLQHTLDRAVLAAADLDQSLNPEDVVNDYFEKAGMGNYLSEVNITQGLNFRTVNVVASTASPTQFMQLMGVEELNVPAVGTAQEKISKVEISLVLDISGSMRHNSRMENLKDASKTFAQKLITDDTQDLISINIVPYSEHVNVGEDIFNAIPNKNVRHGFSHCLEIPDDNFDEVGLDSAHEYDQMQHFQWYYDNLTTVENTTCPSRRDAADNELEVIVPFSQNLNALEATIDALEPRAQTSIFLGVKWGAALLDPSSRPIIQNMVSQGTVDPVFSNRPSDYADEDTLKTLVVMTDGRNTDSHRIADWAYDSNSDYVFWRTYNFNYYLSHYVRSGHSNWYWKKYDGTSGDALTEQICTAAKDAGIVIWGVGLEVDSHGADVLQDCASSPSHFFEVEGVEISEAFSAIATQINQLRLTQ